jgi:hypothetical protein
VQGDRVRRMAGWTVAGEHRSAAGRAFSAEELGDVLPLLYGTLPPIQPETSLVDAMVGIDPAVTGGA